MALPSLVQLQLHTGGAAGREVEGDPNLLWNIANQYLKSITTVEEACAILSGDSQGANNRPQAVDSDVRAAVRLALIKDGQREALAERTPSIAACYGPEALALTIDRPVSKPYQLEPSHNWRIEPVTP